jgi:16S rRNA (uracil1498-N3)-methyltransferase
MPKERFFFEQHLNQSETICIKDTEFHHLVNVMRAKVNDRIEIVNGMGQLGRASVKSIEKKQASLFIEEVLSAARETNAIILAQAIPRPNRLDFILEKGTELGMTEIWLFPGKLSERKTFSDNQPDRMKSVLISAMKQCGRLYLPKIVLKPELEKWKELQYPAYFGDVETNAPEFLDVYKGKNEKEGGNDKDKAVIFFIGSESGFTDSEVQALRGFGAIGVKLSSNILRTDTAALVALALIGAANHL